MALKNTWVKVIGVGPGDPGYLTLKSIELIQESDVIVGDRVSIDVVRRVSLLDLSRKEIVILDSSGEKFYNELFRILETYKGKVVVLSTGDPTVAGISKLYEKWDEIIPGISSVQLCASRFNISIEDSAIISMRYNLKLNILKISLESGLKVFILPPPHLSTKTFLEKVSELVKLENCFFVVCEELSTPREVLAFGKWGNILNMEKLRDGRRIIFVDPGHG